MRRFEVERERAEQRNDMYWGKVTAKQRRLIELDRQLEEAEAEERQCVLREKAALDSLQTKLNQQDGVVQKAQAKLRAAMTEAGLGQPARVARGRAAPAGRGRAAGAAAAAAAAQEEERRRLRELPEFRPMQHALGVRDLLTKDRDIAVKVQRTPGLEYKPRGTPEGRTWATANHAHRTAHTAVRKCAEAVKECERPPALLLHPLPDCTAHEDDARTVLFFLFPESTSCQPWLGRAVFDAEQALLPLSTDDFGSWKVADATRVTHEEHSWRKHFNEKQKETQYLPEKAAGSTAPIVLDPTFLQLVYTAPAKGLNRLRQETVRTYERVASTGVWHPGLDLKLVWHGGPCAPAGVPTRAPSTPFIASERHGSGNAAKARSMTFTEPGSLRLWSRCAVRADSRLADAQYTPPRIVETSEPDDKKRGNAVIAQSHARPACMSVEQWHAFAGLRSFPNEQLPRLCSALHDGILDDVLDHPDVRPPPPPDFCERR